MNYDEDEWGCVDDTLERRQWEESQTLRDILIQHFAEKIRRLKIQKELKNASKNSRQKLSDRR